MKWLAWDSDLSGDYVPTHIWGIWPCRIFSRSREDAAERKVWRESGISPTLTCPCSLYIHIWGFQRKQTPMSHGGRTFEGIETRHPYRGLSGWKRRASFFTSLPTPIWGLKRSSVSTAPAFQIEFGIRDAKQFTGLQSQQTRDKDRLDFAFNLSFTALNRLQGGHKERLSDLSLAQFKRLMFESYLASTYYFDLRKISASQKIPKINHRLAPVSGLAKPEQPQILPNHWYLIPWQQLW